MHHESEEKERIKLGNNPTRNQRTEIYNECFSHISEIAPTRKGRQDLMKMYTIIVEPEAVVAYVPWGRTLR